MTIAFTIASIFWILAPVVFLIGRLVGIWNFHKDILIFSVLMELCFLVCLIHVCMGISRQRREDLDTLNMKKLVNKMRRYRNK